MAALTHAGSIQKSRVEKGLSVSGLPEPKQICIGTMGILDGQAVQQNSIQGGVCVSMNASCMCAPETFPVTQKAVDLHNELPPRNFCGQRTPGSHT